MWVGAKYTNMRAFPGHFTFGQSDLALFCQQSAKTCKKVSAWTTTIKVGANPPILVIAGFEVALPVFVISMFEVARFEVVVSEVEVISLVETDLQDVVLIAVVATESFKVSILRIEADFRAKSLKLLI